MQGPLLRHPSIALHCQAASLRTIWEEEIHVLNSPFMLDAGCIMPPQVLRSRYIDRKKLAALLNTLYKKGDFSITLKLDNWIIDIPEPLTQVGLTIQYDTPFLTALLGANRFM
ncbi:hypothetical protein IMSHALPRED_005946 [Imshaugia aleurites]|uniref:Uncharacterized protein n=1 Tax=Imshaugia aleurites TaxID=172621 RepID=A0A8H3FFF1_9LECA|nr:hypothetical protein IMSHALPRED_005946 [Imshaugia aleurites]